MDDAEASGLESELEAPNADGAPEQPAFETVRCPLVHITPALPKTAHADDAARMSGAQAADVLVAIIQHIVVQLQLTAWSVPEHRRRSHLSCTHAHLIVCSSVCSSWVELKQAEQQVRPHCELWNFPEMQFSESESMQLGSSSLCT
jgi:hypothetical protein